ncbi:hypothetical protein [Gordonia sp. (in: high G+C Gram-positive bacteria)]|uniref:hypothetical protein n=1 Tax=Gordonia sp. (in: high G+C Gram-positive bacteria) TaxID=84139 RepID=UPI003F9CFB4C
MAEAMGELFESTSVMHASADWQATSRDVETVLGSPSFSDGAGWAAWSGFKLSDEAAGPAWSILAKTRNLAAVIAAAHELGWAVGEPTVGGHETRVPLTAPSGLSVIAYEPAG